MAKVSSNFHSWFLSIMEELQHNNNAAELAADITNQFWQRNHVYRVDILRFQ
jgi:hypothetical protein